ncbi:lysM and putative peptidoglycan-binding domain-containing protein 3 [Cephus cinctus]|uniref:LysM and putative peptidoglycan-binding domain-containing protein 3 n=1 Tax=Cephus cinctus TaxID=211228 RepID=A0AAJ7BFD1_CEPCN|nr:lysM and putative peptidoglycan-binding domain-containing protein 3 [Cephus cinctus]
MRKKSINSGNEQKNIRQSAYIRSGQRESSPHYVLLYSDDENSGDEENIPLKPQTHTSSPPRKVEVIKIQIKPEDTLQALALKYRCTISELKRINNIHKENEIYAHRVIKVPIQPFSILTETLAQNGDDRNVEVGELIKTEDGPSTSREEQIINLITTPVTPLPAPKTEINNIILNSVCEPLSQSSRRDLVEIEESEYDQLLNCSDADHENAPESYVTDTFKCSGADWGLSWPQLVGCSLLLGFAGPIIYILFLTEYSFKHHETAGH